MADPINRWQFGKLDAGGGFLRKLNGICLEFQEDITPDFFNSYRVSDSGSKLTRCRKRAESAQADSDMTERPTKAELSKLPHRAVVAYLVRNALRALPAFSLLSSRITAPEFRAHASALLDCVSLAIRFSANEWYLSDAELQENVVPTVDAAYAAARAAFTTEIPNYLDQAAIADAATRAAFAADAVTGSAARAAFIASATRPEEPDPGSEVVARELADGIAAAHDFALLQAAVNTSHGKSFTIDPRESGPLGSLWPEGAPDWYRSALIQWEAVLNDVGYAPIEPKWRE